MINYFTRRREKERVIASVAKQSRKLAHRNNTGLLRRFAPRNDADFFFVFFVLFAV
jgi:hypothetical protein